MLLHLHHIHGSDRVTPPIGLCGVWPAAPRNNEGVILARLIFEQTPTMGGPPKEEKKDEATDRELKPEEKKKHKKGLSPPESPRESPELDESREKPVTHSSSPHSSRSKTTTKPLSHTATGHVHSARKQ